MKEIFSKKTLALIALIPVLLATCYLLLAVPSAQAQDVQLLPNASPNDVKVETAPYEGQDYQIRTASVGSWVFGKLGEAITTSLFGDNPENKDGGVASWVGGAVIESLIGGTNVLLGGTGEETPMDDFQPSETTSNPLAHGGVIGAMGGMIGEVYSNYPNLKTGDFFKNTLANNILSSPAQATGVDEIKDANIDDLWKVMRNVSYIFMVLILIAMGFMVMLRARIDPRTTMTLSAALPKVAVSLVLIAFSLPIAGIIIDLSRVLTGLIESVFTNEVGLEPIGVSISSIWSNFIWEKGVKIAFGFGLQYSIVELFLQLIVRVITFAASLMIFWTLISRYASLLISVIFAPLSFLWGTLPGQGDTTSNWFKSFIVNALTFPGIYLVINIANWIRRTSIISLPPTWAGTTSNISGLIALGVLLTATKIPAILEDALEVAPSAGVSRAGLQTGSVLKQVPLIGRFAK